MSKTAMPPLAAKGPFNSTYYVDLIGPSWTKVGRELFAQLNETLGFSDIGAWPMDYVEASAWADKHKRKQGLDNWMREMRPAEPNKTYFVAAWFSLRTHPGFHTIQIRHNEDGTFYIHTPLVPGMLVGNDAAAKVLTEFWGRIMVAPTPKDV